MAHGFQNPVCIPDHNNQQHHATLSIQPSSASGHDQRAYEESKAKEIEELVAPASSIPFFGTYDPVLELGDSSLATNINQPQHSCINIPRPWDGFVANQNQDQECGGYRDANVTPLMVWENQRCFEEPFNAIGEVAVISGVNQKREVFGRRPRRHRRRNIKKRSDI